jgi:hypothetical protein
MFAPTNHAARLPTPALQFIITQYLVDRIMIGYLASVADSILRVREAESSCVGGKEVFGIKSGRLFEIISAQSNSRLR